MSLPCPLQSSGVPWVDTLPWITYPTSSYSTFASATDIQTAFQFSSSVQSNQATSGVGVINIVMSMYAVNGTWLGLKK